MWGAQLRAHTAWQESLDTLVPLIFTSPWNSCVDFSNNSPFTCPFAMLSQNVELIENSFKDLWRVHIDEISAINKPWGILLFQPLLSFSSLYLLNKNKTKAGNGLSREHALKAPVSAQMPDMIIMIPKQTHPVNPPNMERSVDKKINWQISECLTALTFASKCSVSNCRGPNNNNRKKDTISISRDKETLINR